VAAVHHALPSPGKACLPAEHVLPVSNRMSDEPELLRHERHSPPCNRRARPVARAHPLLKHIAVRTVLPTTADRRRPDRPPVGRLSGTATATSLRLPYLRRKYMTSLRAHSTAGCTPSPTNAQDMPSTGRKRNRTHKNPVRMAVNHPNRPFAESGNRPAR